MILIHKDTHTDAIGNLASKMLIVSPELSVIVVLVAPLIPQPVVRMVNAAIEIMGEAILVVA
jgi:hypothetical protein